MKKKLYPLKFAPILKDKIWGGHKLKTVLNKNSLTKTTGESWELSDVGRDTSVVVNGEHKGATLKELLIEYKSDLLGKNNYDVFGNTFPLLIKFIDAKEDLSIQLHPNDSLAKKRHNSFGKTEMWYVLQADKDSKLIVGFNQEMNSEKYNLHVENRSLTDILNFEKVKEGDTYFIEEGRVHAIGSGVLLAEIQQTSDITYRIYDWDRVDSKGESRELHNDLALEAINYNHDDKFRVQYSKQKNISNTMVSCPYFTTNYLDLDSNYKMSNSKDSFLIYMCVDGDVRINYKEGEVKLNKGETILIPAALTEFEIITNKAKLLEVFV